jgi:ABC-type nitrate/sulfonate/bicarbonate transport system substrate-binding protein
MSTRSRLYAVFSFLLAISFVLAACGGAAPAATDEPAQVVRFVFAPDPVLKYMVDTGIVATYEEKYNMRLQTISTWDEAAFFGGGHADIASTGDYEVPALMKESGQDYVVFGIYNLGRVPIFVKTDSPYHTIKDLEGKKIGVPGPLSSTMIWGVMLAKTEGVDFRVGTKQFDLQINDHMVNGQLLREGQIDAGVIIPEALLPEIAAGTVRPLYDEGSTWEYYRDYLDPAKQHKGVPGNIFLATRAWYDANPKAVEFFLAMWQAGIDAWKANRHDFIVLYPGDWGIDPESPTFDADVAAMEKWLTDHDWFVDSVYLDQTWIDKEMPLFDLMKSEGFMPQDMPVPNFVVVAPPKK